MIKFRWIKMSLFLMPVLQFTAAAAGQLSLSFTVRVGDEVTLSCENVIDGQQKCDSTTWLFSKSRNTAAVELIKLGQIGERAKYKSDRLSVTVNCSLLIKKVTVEDVGRYDCQQFKSGDKQAPDSVVYLSVVNMTEHKDPDKVTLTCSVSTYERCRHTVKWLYVGKDVDKDNKDLVTSQSPCNASLNFLTSHFIHTSRSNFLTCEVTVGNKVQLFPFRLRPSGEKPGEDTTTESTTTENSRKAGITTTASAINDASTELQGWWWLYIIVAVVLVALLVIAVAVIRWKRTKGNKTRMNDNVELTSNPAVTQSETSQDTADPEDGVSYASVSYTSKTKNSKARVQSKNDEGDAVTYAVVKASSADPSSFYATIN